MKGFQKFLGALIFFVIGILLGWSLPRETPPPLEREDQVAAVDQSIEEISLMFDQGGGVIKTYPRVPLTGGESLFDLTQRVAVREGMSFKNDPPGQYGILITEIDGKKNGTNGQYWSYWVNNQMGEVASDVYRLKPGDVIEWKFVNLKF